jgi:hypothetical protein
VTSTRALGGADLASMPSLTPRPQSPGPRAGARRAARPRFGVTKVGAVLILARPPRGQKAIDGEWAGAADGERQQASDIEQIRLVTGLAEMRASRVVGLKT